MGLTSISCVDFGEGPPLQAVLRTVGSSEVCFESVRLGVECVAPDNTGFRKFDGFKVGDCVDLQFFEPGEQVRTVEQSSGCAEGGLSDSPASDSIAPVYDDDEPVPSTVTEADAGDTQWSEADLLLFTSGCSVGYIAEGDEDFARGYCGCLGSAVEPIMTAERALEAFDSVGSVPLAELPFEFIMAGDTCLDEFDHLLGPG